jgi:tetratricopeptide (TPR) repeat protein
MQPMTADLARTFTDAEAGEIRIGKAGYRAAFDATGGWVVEQDGDGETRYRIDHALGGKNVFYFLTELDRGKLQVLPVAFDVRTGQWFDTAGSALRHFADLEDEAWDWRQPAFTFNTSCHGCHVSQLSTNYDLDTDTYRTTWKEPGINCETCHGPARAHADLFRNDPAGQSQPDWKIIRTTTFAVEQTNEMCASCHAKLMPLTASFPPGGRFFDHYDLVSYEHADFYPDGRDLGENYTYTSWLTSPCARSGQLDCLHCHTSSGRYRFGEDDANGACLPCHQRRVEESIAHTRHPPGSPGDRCIACHMPRTEFARMVRSDHSMRPPTPAATLQYGSPNACNLCHTDRDPAWADRLVREWRGRDFQAPVLERAGLIDAARRREWSRLPDMLAFVDGGGGDDSVTTSLIRLLRSCDDERVGPVLLGALRHPSPLVRAAAAEALGERLTAGAVQPLLRATADAYRLVRVRAAAALAGVPPRSVPMEFRDDLSRAVNEFTQTALSRPDDWTAHYNIGNYLMAGNDPEGAVAAYGIASRLRPDAAAPLVNAALAYNRMDRNTEAEAVLRQAITRDPESEAAHYNLGLLLGEVGRAEEAAAVMETVLGINPEAAAAAYNLCVLRAEERPAAAIDLCRRAAEIDPDNPKYLYTLAFFLDRNGDTDGAVRILNDLIDRHPDHADSILFLGAILERRGEIEAAVRLLRTAGADPALPAELRRNLENHARELQSRSPEP